MDTKNVIAAISLSAAVIILYGLFFAPSTQDVKKVNDDKNILIQNSEAPKLDDNENKIELSREDALKETERVEFENENIKGSISLVGGIIDDLIFKKYTKSLESSEKVVFLNPKNIKNGFFVETGWVTNNKNINLPNSKTLWKLENNTKLLVNNPIKLIWTNIQGITFEKKISIDDKYLFTIEQSIINQSNNTYNFYPYGQIIRNETPEVTGFYILHEGLIGVFNDQLVEEDYKDIKKKNISFDSSNGWLGITDKYFAATVIPESNKEFRSDFDFKDRFRASFIYNKSTEVGANETKTNKIKVLIPAKEVDVIDGYADAENINKYDLVIDFGWFYFIVKPLFFAIQYFFEMSGNFGLAIILITVCIRLAFFPLANMSFRSMAKMKVLQPEMARLKELHKDDKMKLQQAMMALYKKEKVNPLSGCLPILLQIPFFFAIYKMLYISIEMRHQPFYGWIKDLSDRDPTTIFNLFGIIPWDPPSFLMIGALPCLMGITMYLQQKLNPTPPDPIQAKIFMFFPLFLTVILAPFASGLVLYWTANNILTMAQQVVIMKRTTVRTVQKN